MEEKPVTIWAREALFARRDRLPDELVEKILNKYEFRFYEEKSCQSCEFLFERPGPMCEDCAANKGSALLAREVNIDGVTYLKMPIGSADDSLDLFDDYKVKYKLKADHPRVPMSRKITFTATLRDYQRQVVDAMHRERRGVVKAVPRSGKTVCGTAFICEVGEKAIVLASQKEWLDGFKETFIGSKTQPPMTDCLPSQIGYCKKPEDFDKYDVCLVTPQTFIRHPEWLDIVYEKASVVIVDEVRLSAAPKYAKVVASLNTRHYIGLDGTPSRSKDCVAKETEVTMTDGSTKSIEDVEVGDLVKSYNPETSIFEDGVVTQTFKRDNSSLVRVYLDDDRFVTCTPDHKFWCENRKDWVAARDLTEDDLLIVED